MRRPLIALMALAALAAALWIVRGALDGRGAAGQPAAAQAAGEAPPPQPLRVPAWAELARADEEPVDRPVAIPLEELGASLPDPLARAAGLGSPSEAQAPAPELDDGLVLQAVVAGSRPMALISGRIVRPGETIGRARLLRVESSSVVLEGAGRSRLYLPAPGVREAAGARSGAAP